jgi:hypothetical protein
VLKIKDKKTAANTVLAKLPFCFSIKLSSIISTFVFQLNFRFGNFANTQPLAATATPRQIATAAFCS